MKVTAEVVGIETARAKLRTERLVAAPARRFFSRASILVQSRAREIAPVDTGRLRNSIAYELDGNEVPLWAKVGTNVDYARFQELGTSPGHFPPPDALEPWARRHGFSSGGGFLVARAISRRGLRPKRFLRGGLEQSQGKIVALLPIFAAEIEQSAGGGG